MVTHPASSLAQDRERSPAEIDKVTSGEENSEFCVAVRPAAILTPLVKALAVELSDPTPG